MSFGNPNGGFRFGAGTTFNNNNNINNNNNNNNNNIFGAPLPMTFGGAQNASELSTGGFVLLLINLSNEEIRN